MDEKEEIRRNLAILKNAKMSCDCEGPLHYHELVWDGDENSSNEYFCENEKEHLEYIDHLTSRLKELG